MTSLTCTFLKNLSMVYDHYIYLQENHLVEKQQGPQDKQDCMDNK